MREETIIVLAIVVLALLWRRPQAIVTDSVVWQNPETGEWEVIP